ncbi:MAG: 2-hydroxyacid dehydrogenase [Alphaproteobacteria bacterium]|jgi:phosphoglycerate dehydrogenase-like enzyme|nr:hydroxyacid dehydrogenase [Rhodospirillaceae bacterium]MDP6404007.1 2-hydroxyacid dehydrogenase [Alphaproteobacteria bacterium]MDP6624206.1 2-hydroxyacid dehydrogenase [Alphaproteobacteria bacterium]
MKITIDYRLAPELEARLAGLAEQGLEVRAGQTEAELAALAPDTDVLWHVLKPVTAEFIATAKGLLQIQKFGIGVNTIDLEAAGERNIPVCNMPGTNSRAVAELALGLMIAVLRRVVRFDAAMRRGQGWASIPELQAGAGEIGGRTVGLLGYGAVARVLGPVLAALGARVIYHDLVEQPEAAAEPVDFGELLASSDILSLHIPLTSDSEGLIDARALARMKPGAVLINTARGELVEEAALVAALSDGRLAGAGLDVFAVEPIRDDNPLLALENVVLTPHVAWLTGETFGRSLEMATENCRRLVAGEALLHRVV